MKVACSHSRHTMINTKPRDRMLVTRPSQTRARSDSLSVTTSTTMWPRSWVTRPTPRKTIRAIAISVISTVKVKPLLKTLRAITSQSVTTAIRASAPVAMRASQSVISPFSRPTLLVSTSFMTASVRGGFDHLLQVVEQLLPVDAFGIGLLEPLVGGRLQQGPPFVELGGRDGLDC